MLFSMIQGENGLSSQMMNSETYLQLKGKIMEQAAQFDKKAPNWNQILIPGIKNNTEAKYESEDSK